MLSCRSVTELLLINLIVAAKPEGAPNWLPPALLALGIVIMFVMVTRSLRSRSARKRAEYLTPREHIDQIKARHRSRRVDDAAASEFVTTATELATRLENKAERLEQLILQADQRLVQLRHAIDQLDSQAAGDARVVYEGEGDDDVQIGDAFDGSESPSAELQQDDPLASAVVELAGAGHSPIEIAQQLNEQVGKVELILALRRR